MGICKYRDTVNKMRCCKKASFNEPGKTRGVFCAQHAPDDYQNVVRDVCVEEGCTKTASYNHDGEPCRYCRKHAKPYMICRKQGNCRIKGCSMTARFGNADDKKALRCFEHKLPEHVEVYKPYMIKPPRKKRVISDSEDETVAKRQRSDEDDADMPPVKRLKNNFARFDAASKHLVASFKGNIPKENAKKFEETIQAARRTVRDVYKRAKAQMVYAEAMQSTMDGFATHSDDSN